MYPDEWIAGRKWDAPRAPLCKGSCREATEGLCGTNFRLWKCIGEKVRGNDFAVESSGFGGTSAKWGQKGLCTFGRWAHRKVCHYNPSVSFADSSPYTGEPCPSSTTLPFIESALKKYYFSIFSYALYRKCPGCQLSSPSRAAPRIPASLPSRARTIRALRSAFRE